MYAAHWQKLERLCKHTAWLGALLGANACSYDQAHEGNSIGKCLSAAALGGVAGAAVGYVAPFIMPVAALGAPGYAWGKYNSNNPRVA